MSDWQFIDNWQKRQEDKRRFRIEKEIRERFQVKEHNGALWLTYRGELLFPCEYLKGEPLQALDKFRQIHINESLTF